MTIDLFAGKIALTGGDVTIRRSAHLSSGTTVSGHGTVSAGAIYNAGLLEASGGTLNFIGPFSQSGLARIESGATMEFGGQTIDLLGVAANALSKSGTALVVKEGSKVVADIALRGVHTFADFKLSSDGHSGMDISYAPPGSARLHRWHGI